LRGGNLVSIDKKRSKKIFEKIENLLNARRNRPTVGTGVSSQESEFRRRGTAEEIKYQRLESKNTNKKSKLE
jgi:hypothetical protein